MRPRTSRRLVMKRSPEALTELRHLAEVRFAKSFSEDVFAEYVTRARTGGSRSPRCRSRDDPMLARTRAIRVREGLFMDRLADALRCVRPAHRHELRRLAGAQPDRGQGEERSARPGPWCRAWWARCLQWAVRTPQWRAAGTQNSGQEVAGVAAAIAGGVLIAKSFQNSAEGKVHCRGPVGARRVARRRGRAAGRRARGRRRRNSPATRVSSFGSGGRFSGEFMQRSVPRRRPSEPLNGRGPGRPP